MMRAKHLPQFRDIGFNLPTLNYEYGIEWTNVQGCRSRGNLPVVYSTSHILWMTGDITQRSIGPAYILTRESVCSRYWCFAGHFHRTDGPAVIHSNGKTEYWVLGKRKYALLFKLSRFVFERFFQR